MTNPPFAHFESNINIVCYDSGPLVELHKQFSLLLTGNCAMLDPQLDEEGFWVLTVYSERGDILESCISSFKGYIEEHGYGSFDLEESFLHHNSVGVNLENLLSDTLKDLKFKETVKRSSEKIVELAREVVALKSMVSYNNKQVSELKDFISNQTLQYEALLKILDQTNLNFQTLGLPTVESYYVEIH